jgi:hypothetical protein
MDFTYGLIYQMDLKSPVEAYPGTPPQRQTPVLGQDGFALDVTLAM